MDFNTDVPTMQELVGLYDSVRWNAYTTEPEKLLEAVRNSTFVVTARDSGDLVGLARGLTDEVSILYLQDVLVHPTRQGEGIGRSLLQRCLDPYEHVRQKVLLTDDESHQHRFYESFGFVDVASLRRVPLHAFVRVEGARLE